MALAHRRWWGTLSLWLLLATALGHALLPVGSPLTKRSGSAFSAATFEVALTGSRPDARVDRLTPKRADSSDPPDLLIAAAVDAPEPAARATLPHSGVAGDLAWPGPGRTAHQPRAPPLA